MSFFGWFKSAPKPNNDRIALANDVRVGDPKDAAARAAEASAAERRKDERARLRELLFKVVRESMVRVGVLSSSFKFKVLATDPRGKKFIVMMDLSRDFGGEVSQLAEIEKLICQSAKARYNIVVSAVYWRAEDVAPSRQPDSAAQPAPVATASAPAVAPTPAVAASAPVVTASAPGVAAPAAGINAATSPGAPRRGYEPVLADEISALKQALAAGAALAANAGRVAAGGQPAQKLTGYETTEIIESELPDTRLPDTEIPETELLDDEPAYPALSATQYGELR